MIYNDLCKRLNLQSLVGFFLYGSDTEIEKNSLTDRLDTYQEKFMMNLTRLENCDNTNQEQIQELSKTITETNGKLEDCHLELGIKIGFHLATKILYEIS